VRGTVATSRNRGSAKSESSWIIDITLGPAARAGGQREDLTRNRIRLDKRGGGVIGVVVAFVVRLTRRGLGLWRATVYPSSRLDLVDRDHTGGKKANEDCNSERHPPLSATPPAQVPRRSAQHPRDALLRDTKRAESLAGVARE
jgi:hypothetical protein